jgi:hypothetical protein
VVVGGEVVDTALVVVVRKAVVETGEGEQAVASTAQNARANGRASRVIHEERPQRSSPESRGCATRSQPSTWNGQ